jgi:mono/diheme cytochrome c family protein
VSGGHREDAGGGTQTRRIALFATAILLGLSAGAYLFLLPIFDQRIDPDDAAQVARGRTIYAQHCAACHGANLEGEPNWMQRKDNGRMPAPPHDASGHTWHHSDAQLVELTKKGVSGILPGYVSDMPGFEDILNDAEIRLHQEFMAAGHPRAAKCAEIAAQFCQPRIAIIPMPMPMPAPPGSI